MDKSDKDIDQRTIYNKKTQRATSWATTGKTKNKDYIPTYYLLSEYDDLDEPIAGRNPCGFGGFSEYLRNFNKK